MKKVISVLVLTMMLISAFSICAFADDTSYAGGFYNIEVKDGITVTPAASIGSIEEVSVDVDGDEVAETVYKGSDKLNVTYSDAINDAYYGIILVEGTGLPTKDNQIFYIDQLTAKEESISFEVYPILPEETTVLTLYISCSDSSQGLLSTTLYYTPDCDEDEVPDEPEYTLGDVDNNGLWNSQDALLALKIGADMMPDATIAEKLAADVDTNNTWNAQDALKILQFAADIIDSWEE